MRDERMQREVNEAIEAGERALYSLRRAQEKLSSARNWGIYDMLGGGFFSTMIKHSRLEDASGYMEDARHDLHIFQRELRDVQVPADFRMEISDFLTFADFFFDGILADYLVQTKISEAREQVTDAIAKVSHLLSELRKV